MRRSLRLLPASLHIIFLIALLGAAAVSSSVPSISSDIRASVERNATHWIPWFDLGVEALSKSKPDVALRAFLLSARLSGHPAAWSNAGFALTKTPGGPHPIMLHYFAAAFRIAPDTAAAIFLAQAMIMLSMHQRALEFTTLFLTRNCGRRSFPQFFSQPQTCDMALRSLSRSASNCVWRSGKPKILLHSGAAVDARSDMFAAAAYTDYHPVPTRPQVQHINLQQAGRGQRACVLVRHAAADVHPLANPAARCHALPQVRCFVERSNES